MAWLGRIEDAYLINLSGKRFALTVDRLDRAFDTVIFHVIRAGLDREGGCWAVGCEGPDVGGGGWQGNEIGEGLYDVIGAGDGVLNLECDLYPVGGILERGDL